MGGYMNQYIYIHIYIYIYIYISIYIYINQLFGKCRLSQFLAMNLASLNELGHVSRIQHGNPHAWNLILECENERLSDPNSKPQIWKTSLLSTDVFPISLVALSPTLAAQNTDSYQLHDFCRSFLNTAFKFDGWFTIDSRVCPMIPVFSLAELPTFCGSIMDINSWTLVRWSISVETSMVMASVCCRLNILNPRSFDDLRASLVFFCHPMFLLIEVYYYMVYCIVFLQTITVHSWIVFLDIEDIHDLFVWSRPSWKIHSKS